MRIIKKIFGKKGNSSMDPLKNYKKALTQLKEFIAEPVQNKRDRAGVIQGFEFTFEQAWKSIQKTAAAQGVEIGNPKKAFSYAMQNGWISQGEEALWLTLLRDRNLTPHTYEEELAEEVMERIASSYVLFFEQLLKKLIVENKATFRVFIAWT